MKKIRKLLLIIFIVILSIGAFYIYKGYTMYQEVLAKTPISDKVESIKAQENYTQISQLPQIYLNAVLSAEDHRFYKHHGIDVVAIGRALIHDIKNKSFSEGGSTITQQLAKNIYFTQEKKIERKIAEVFMAFQLEKELEKDDILELYLNTSYFGKGFYTVKDASMGYFNKKPSAMNDYESTLLAGIPNAPSIYSVNLELAHQRQNQILDLMIEYKYLTEEEKENILSQKPTN